jgi:hypothetical protein
MEAYSAVYAPQELTEEQIWEEVENWVNSLLEEGYDLSDYTWEEMYEAYIEEQGPRSSGGPGSIGYKPRMGTETGRQLSQVFGQGKALLGDTPRNTPAPGTRQNLRGGGSRPVGTGSVTARPAASTAAEPYKSRFAGARDAAFQKAQGIKGSPVVGSRPSAPAPAATARPSGAAPAAAAARPSGTAAAAPAAKSATPAPAAKPAAETGPTGKPLVGGIERRTPTRAEMDAAKAYRTPAATTGTLGSATAAASKPAAFSPSSSTPSGGALSAATAAASKPPAFSPTPAAATPTPAAATPAPAPKPTPAATGSKKPGSIVSSFDPFDVVIGHLLDEGYADTEEAALAIMANMSGEWRESIVEAQVANRDPDAYEEGERKKETRGQSAERKVRGRLATMDPEKRKRMIAQMRAVGLDV